MELCIGDYGKVRVNIGFSRFFGVVWQVFLGIWFHIFHDKIRFGLYIMYLRPNSQENLPKHHDNGE